MTDTATTPSPNPADAEARAVAAACVGRDPRESRDVRQLAMLREMQDGGMAIQGLLLAVARIDARRQSIAEQTQDPPPPSRLVAIGRAHAGMVRAVRQLIETENRIDDARLDRQAGIVREVIDARKAKADSAAAFARYVADHRQAVEEVMEQIIETEVGEDDDRANDLLERMYDAAEAMSVKAGFLNHCVGELADRLSRDLGLTPDWDQLADQDWAEEEAEQQMEGSPYGPPVTPPRVVRGDDGRYRFSARLRKTGPP